MKRAKRVKRAGGGYWAKRAKRVKRMIFRAVNRFREVAESAMAHERLLAGEAQSAGATLLVGTTFSGMPTTPRSQKQRLVAGLLLFVTLNKAWLTIHNRKRKLGVQ